MFKEFREFALRGSVVDMAVGMVIGAAFGTSVKSFVDDVLMPPIGLLLGKVDFANLFLVLKAGAPAPPYLSLADARDAGAVTLNYGAFANTIVSFLILAFAVSLLPVRHRPGGGSLPPLHLGGHPRLAPRRGMVAGRPLRGLRASGGVRSGAVRLAAGVLARQHAPVAARGLAFPVLLLVEGEDGVGREQRAPPPQWSRGEG